MSSPTDVSTKRAAAMRALLVETVEAEPASRRRFRRLFALWGSIGVLSVGGLAIASAAVVDAERVDGYELVHCLGPAERGANGKYDDMQAMLEPGKSVDATIDDAVRLCTLMWEQGALPTDKDPLASEPTGSLPVPDLVVCVMKDGNPAVVPGEASVCNALGLAPLATD